MSNQGTMPMSGAGSGAATSTTESAAREAGHVAQTVKEDVRDVGRQAQQGASQLFEEAKDRVRVHGDDYAGRFAESLRSFARELRDMSEAGRNEESSEQRVKLSEWTSMGAGQLDRFAERLEQGGMDNMLDEVRGLARRHTGGFLAGAMAAGFATGRLVRNSGGGNSGREWGDRSRYGGELYGGYSSGYGSGYATPYPASGYGQYGTGYREYGTGATGPAGGYVGSAEGTTWTESSQVSDPYVEPLGSETVGSESFGSGPESESFGSRPFGTEPRRSEDDR